MSPKTAKSAYTPARPAVTEKGRRTWPVVLGIVLAFAVGVPVGLGIAHLGTNDSDQAVAEMQRAEAHRDAARITELTTMARETKQVVRPVVDGLTLVAPDDGSAASQATAAQLSEWKKVMEQERQRYSETVSGSTGTNVARNALGAAVNLLSTSLDTYSVAAELPADRRPAVIELAARQRSLAVATWSVAATQLDQLNVDSGNGHQHVYLTDAESAVMDDGFEEGSHG
ncbi:hypothetical protein Pth03_74260 [Planotetraspora thailandica]|uniref:Uncharacterized protein n=1 Tax=Planotetraspora thailandica TaxID=487172 RepID=A0A8J3Y1I3_9ACTN|nr:hypothetical protein [Planotetraspora thailandica]GII59037.1 hypothetical protein Pth03_74260 [Planotetraspora thailandica]